MQPFTHNFKSIIGVIDIAGINGYIQALNSLYSNILTATDDLKPENRYIDAGALLERITATTKELKTLLEEAGEELKDELKTINEILNS